MTEENKIQTEINQALSVSLTAVVAIVVTAFAINFYTGNSAVFKGLISGTLCGYGAFCLLIMGTKKSLQTQKGKLMAIVFMALRLTIFAAFFIAAVKKTSINFPAAVISCIFTYQAFVIKTGVTALLKVR